MCVSLVTEVEEGASQGMLRALFIDREGKLGGIYCSSSWGTLLHLFDRKQARKHHPSTRQLLGKHTPCVEHFPCGARHPRLISREPNPGYENKVAAKKAGSKGGHRTAQRYSTILFYRQEEESILLVGSGGGVRDRVPVVITFEK